jgi:hypothetical protein
MDFEKTFVSVRKEMLHNILTELSTTVKLVWLIKMCLRIFPSTIASRKSLGPTQPPIQCVPEALSLGVKRPGREADHSPPSSAKVK